MPGNERAITLRRGQPPITDPSHLRPARPAMARDLGRCSKFFLLNEEDQCPLAAVAGTRYLKPVSELTSTPKAANVPLVRVMVSGQLTSLSMVHGA